MSQCRYFVQRDVAGQKRRKIVIYGNLKRNNNIVTTRLRQKLKTRARTVSRRCVFTTKNAPKSLTNRSPTNALPKKLKKKKKRSLRFHATLSCYANWSFSCFFVFVFSHLFGERVRYFRIPLVDAFFVFFFFFILFYQNDPIRRTCRVGPAARVVAIDPRRPSRSLSVLARSPKRTAIRP